MAHYMLDGRLYFKFRIVKFVHWLSIAIFGSLPFIFSTIELTITDAFFESMSGITTTGSTIISNLEETPKGILLWRAILQWLGGIGIIVMAITLMPIMNVGGMQLFKISSNDSSEKILPKSKEIALRLIYIYLGLTAICAITYWVFGMGKFDSLTHSMTTIATGGFSNYNQSIGYFDSVPIEISSMVFIILGSLPFIAYIKFILQTLLPREAALMVISKRLHIYIPAVNSQSMRARTFYQGQKFPRWMSNIPLAINYTIPILPTTKSQVAFP